MELCEGPFGPTAGCLSSPHMARWLLYTLTFSISPSIYFSFLFLAAVLIRRWIHAVLVLTPHSMSCETHTSDTANGAARETTREKNMPYCGQADMDTCVHSSFKTSDSECQTTHLAFFLQSFLFVCGSCLTLLNSPSSGRQTVLVWKGGIWILLFRFHKCVYMWVYSLLCSSCTFHIIVPGHV